METSDYDFHYETYRRVPMNSATTQKDIAEFNSIGTYSTYSVWSRSTKPTLTTKYIDAMTMLGQYDRSYNMNDLFPKGKGRQKPLNSSEKKNARDAYMSLLPTDASTNRSEKTRSPLSMTTPPQTSSNLPEVLPKNVNIRNDKRLLHARISNDNGESKPHTRSASTHASGAWIRRYKSINESQILSNLLRNQSYGDKILLRKRPYPQALLLSSSITSSLNERRREKC